MPDNLSLDEALDVFASAHSVAAAKQVSRYILNSSGAAKAARDHRLARGIINLHELGLEGSDSHRQAALALAWRLTALTAMREHRRTLIARQRQLSQPFAAVPADILPDPVDREYFAQSLSYVTGDWIPDYLAEAIVREPLGATAVRDALCRAFIEATDSLASQLALIQQYLSSVHLDQVDPNSGRARLVSAVLDSLAIANWQMETERPPGADFGEAFFKLISSELLRGPIAEREAALNATRSAVRFARVAARLHGTLAADAANYRFLDALKRVFAPSDWPDELVPTLDQVSRQIADQLVFLLRQHIRDERLRRVFITLNGAVVGKLKLERLSKSIEGLEPSYAQWLATGKTLAAIDNQQALEETAVAAIDRELSLAFRESAQIGFAIQMQKEELQEAANLYSEQAGVQLGRLLQRIERICRHVDASARRRNLALRGTIGDSVEFAPAEHDPEPDAIGARTVVLRSQIVERVIDGKRVAIIVKADVGRS